MLYKWKLPPLHGKIASSIQSCITDTFVADSDRAVAWKHVGLLRVPVSDQEEAEQHHVVHLPIFTMDVCDVLFPVLLILSRGYTLEAHVFDDTCKPVYASPATLGLAPLAWRARTSAHRSHPVGAEGSQCVLGTLTCPLASCSFETQSDSVNAVEVVLASDAFADFPQLIVSFSDSEMLESTSTFIISLPCATLSCPLPPFLAFCARRVLRYFAWLNTWMSSQWNG